MSEAYEGVIVKCKQSRIHEVFKELTSSYTLSLIQLANEVFGVCFDNYSPGRVFDVLETGNIAVQLSIPLGSALAVFYDNRCSFRKAALYIDGRLVREFNEDDERWVLIDEDGEPLIRNPDLRGNELIENEEYECVKSSIDVGLEKIGVANQIKAETLKNAFIYGL